MTEDTWSLVDDDEAIFGSRQAQIDAFIAQKQLTLEERVVSKVLKHFNAPVLANYIKGKNKESGRDSRLDMYGFRAAISDFPLFLGARHIYKAKDITINSLRKNFYKSELFERFTDLREEASSDGLDGLLGLVFDWQFEGLTILHNDESVLSAPGFRLLYCSTNGKERYILESFTDFLHNVKSWIPTSVV